MKQISKSKHLGSAALFKTTALVATLATAMFASSAQAVVVITEVSRSTFANNNVLPLLEDTSTALSGIYNQTLTRNFFFDEGPANASASQSTNIAPQIFAGRGSTSIENPPGGKTEADSRFQMFFTLTETYVLSGLVSFQNIQSAGFGTTIRFQLSDLDFSNDVDIILDESNPSSILSATLIAGDYFLDVFSSSRNFSSSLGGLASSSFDFSVALTEVDDTPPPNNVPEPGSLALMGAGVLAAAASRRKRPLLPTHA
jgi:hypothetical protein